jgi:tape measure domain-containing protein
MASIGDIVGTLQLNTSGFVAGVAVAKKSVKSIRGGLESIGTTAAKVENSIFSLKSAILGLGAGAIIKDITQTAVTFQSLQQAVSAATGGAVNGAQSMAFLRSEAERLGLNLETTVSSFKTIAAAAQGTSLAGAETRRIFTAVSEAATVMGLSADQTEGSLLALSQMISKGKVSAEELRGQLGERLPGAFQIAAQSMGVTTAELDKMLQEGKVISEDFLPGFATELSKRFSKDVPNAAATARAEFNRLGNSVVEMKLAIANSGLLAFVTALAKAMTTLFTAVGKVIKENVSGGFKSAADQAKQMHDVIGGMIGPVGKFIGTFADGLFLIQFSWKNLRLAIKLGAEAMILGANSVSSGIEGIINAIISFGNKTQGVIKAAAVSLVSTFMPAFGEIQKMINAVIGYINNAIDRLNTIAGVEIEPIANIKISGEDELNEVVNSINTKFTDIKPVQFDFIGGAELTQLTEDVSGLQAEITAMYAAGLPSEKIAKFTEEVQKAFETIKTAAPAAMPVLPGGGAPAAPEASDVGSFLPDMTEEKLTGRIARLQEQFMTEEELLNNTLLNRALLIEESFAQELISEQERNTLLEQIQADHQSKLTDLTKWGLTSRAKFEKMTTSEQVSFFTGALASMTKDAAAHNKIMFNINKAAAIANATVSTAQGAAKALEWGFPLGPVFAGLIVAAGVAQIAGIASTSFGGGGGATPVTQAGSTGNIGGAMATPTGGISETVAAAPAEAAPVQSVTIDLGEEDQLISTSAMRGIIEKIIDTSGDMGVQLRLA